MHKALRPGGDVGALEALRDCGAKIDAVDERGRTALYVAAAEGQLSIVEWLLSSGADPQHVGADGRTPLHAAAANGHVEACELILLAAEEGAYVTGGSANQTLRLIHLRDAAGYSAAELGNMSRHLDVVRCVMNHHRAAELRRLAPPSQAVSQPLPQSWRQPIEISEQVPSVAMFASPARRFSPRGVQTP